MYPEIEGSVIENKELTWTTADINNPEEWRRAREQELDRAEQRIHEAVRRFRELGLIDEHGNRINKKLPPDMREDAERDFGG